MNSANRREFLIHASVWTAVAGGLTPGIPDPFGEPRTLQAADAKGTSVESQHALPIIDTHQHLWDLNEFDLPWTKSPGSESLNRRFLMQDYLAATAGLNVVKSIYMEVDVHPSQQEKEALMVSAICERKDTPMVAAVISGRPSSRDFKTYITKFADNPCIKGVRQVLHGDATEAGYCLQPQFVKGIQLLGELGKSFDLCMRAGEIVDGVKLVDQCPKTRFIVDHCGNMSVQSTDAELRAKWTQGMREMAQRENVVCKISGIVASAKPKTWVAEDLAPNIDFTLDTFGKDRVMFGGDWPVCTLAASYRQWVEALRKIVGGRSLIDQRKLFHDNAERFYGLS